MTFKWPSRPCRVTTSTTAGFWEIFPFLNEFNFWSKGLLKRSPDFNKDLIDYVAAGVVYQDPKTTNVAKEAAFTAGLPDTAAAQTITQACLSSQQSLTSAALLLERGAIDVALIGGVDSATYIPFEWVHDIHTGCNKLGMSCESWAQWCRL